MVAIAINVGVVTGPRRLVAVPGWRGSSSEQGLGQGVVGTTPEREAQWRTTRRFC